MMFENLTSDSVMLYAAHSYTNPQCMSTKEFLEDWKRIKYIKRLLRRYYQTGQLRERLLLNHIILLSNVFPPPSLARLLFFKLEPVYYPALKTLLEFLSLAPPTLPGIKGKTIVLPSITTDLLLKKRLDAL
jgi:hypothetical protein